MRAASAGYAQRTLVNVGMRSPRAAESILGRTAREDAESGRAAVFDVGE